MLPGALLGFALGGFFDGIVLHQVLQWHHLLSGVNGAPFDRMRVQILADGLFHLLMYAVAFVGLWVLWRRRDAVVRDGHALFGSALLGFGAWHVADALVSHWLLGIHRIRMDSDIPMFWDVLWLVVFGLVPMATGWRWRRRGPPGPGPWGPATAAGLVLTTLAAAPLASLSPADTRQVAVAIRPGDAGRLLQGVHALGGGIVWTDSSGAAWVLELPEGSQAGRLYGYGALAVSTSPAVLGCAAFTARMGA